MVPSAKFQVGQRPPTYAMAIDALIASCQPLVSCCSSIINGWREFLLDLPLVLQRIDTGPKANGQTGQVRGTKGGCFRNLGSKHIGAEQIRLKLHQQIVLRGAPVDSQLFDLDAAIGFHRLQYIHRLVGNTFECRRGRCEIGLSPASAL